MSTIEQQRFSPATANTSGRGFSSSTVLEHTRENDTVIELEVSTSHSPQRGYTATVTRASIDSLRIKSITLSFGGDGDVKHITTPDRPTSSRYSKANAAIFHQMILSQIEADMDSWLTWAAQKHR